MVIFATADLCSVFVSVAIVFLSEAFLSFYKDKEKSVTDQRRYSLIDPSSESEVIRLQHRLVSTEDVLRNALEQGHQMEKLMEAMRLSSEKAQVEHSFPRSLSPWHSSVLSNPLGSLPVLWEVMRSAGFLFCFFPLVRSSLARFSSLICCLKLTKALLVGNYRSFCAL